MYGNAFGVPWELLRNSILFSERVQAQISQLRCRQHVLVGELDDAQAPQTDGGNAFGVPWELLRSSIIVIGAGASPSRHQD
jgi:hypothetical protein